MAVSVGYGLNGNIGENWTYNDGFKRAVVTPLFALLHHSTGSVYEVASHPLGKYIDCEKNMTTLLRADPVIGDYGVRYGMSGGGVYLNGDLIAINRSLGYEPSSNVINYVWNKGLSCYQNYLGKYFTALGVSMPFMNPREGDMSVPLSLSIHKDWIEAPVIENGQTLREYLQSWLPHEGTLEMIATIASDPVVIGILSCYWG